MKPLLLCALLLLPSVAWAIPVAGTYVFTPNDPNLSGSFTSTGTDISAWEFHSGLTGFALSWSHETDIDEVGNMNTAQLFITNNGLEPCGVNFCDGYYAQMIWNPDPFAITANFRIDASCCDLHYDIVPTVTFAPAELSVSRFSVPEPATWLLLGMGMLLVIFTSFLVTHAKARLQADHLII